MSYAIAESYVSKTSNSLFNLEAMKLGVRGVTIIVASGDDGAPGFRGSTYSSPRTCAYDPSFPASSPYVVAVGATRGPEVFNAEVACQSDLGGVITSGGGFSNFNPMPSWQKSVVSGYFNTVKGTSSQPVSGYNATGRAIPDLAVVGFDYLTSVGERLFAASGTSVSTPVFAAMVSLVNSNRLQAGKSSLGWITPALYSNYSAFVNDVTSGNNLCATGPGCCTQGFYCATGWDPVTGFGSVNFQNFLSVFGAVAPTQTPTKTPTTSTPSTAPSKAPSVRPSASPSATAPSLYPVKSPTPTSKVAVYYLGSLSSTCSSTCSLEGTGSVCTDSKQLSGKFI
eukprot:gene3220-biopygen3474